MWLLCALKKQLRYWEIILNVHSTKPPFAIKSTETETPLFLETERAFHNRPSQVKPNLFIKARITNHNLRQGASRSVRHTTPSVLTHVLGSHSPPYMLTHWILLFYVHLFVHEQKRNGPLCFHMSRVVWCWSLPSRHTVCSCSKTAQPCLPSLWRSEERGREDAWIMTANVLRPSITWDDTD